MKKQEVRAYYALLPNMGDKLNELLIERVFGLECKRAPVSSSELSCIGSGLDCFMEQNRIYPRWYALAQRARARLASHANKVWCTGFLFSESKDSAFIRKMEFASVRGELTKRRVEAICGRSLDVPTGDGGILAPYLLDKRVSKRHALGIIPHFQEQGHPVFQALQRKLGGTVIDLRADPLEVVKDIASCEVIISSSLHGLIVADAFGIPNQWVMVSSALKGDGFKFADYYSAFGLAPSPIVLSDSASPLPSTNEVVDRYRIDPAVMQRKQEQIYRAFPFGARS